MTEERLTRAEISVVVAKFYAAVREDPTLGPIFAAHVVDWPQHEEKIAAFWRSALLRERGYAGNPMQKHLEASNVTPAHFSQWLDLFDAVLAQTVSPSKARHWSMLAHRIGQSLSYGLTYAANQKSDVPPQLGRH